MDSKWIFITGGVISGLGKGITTASIGKLLSNNKKVITIKCDGYLNVDPGKMSPFEHGEVFVLEDGGEVDMDFGHYERFVNIKCKKEWSITTGKIIKSLIQKEREGKFLGKTVQIIPHMTDEIKNTWKTIQQKEKPDIMLIEIGGTVGDVENQWFIESARQLKKELKTEHTAFTHLSYVNKIKHLDEEKTKPLQRDLETLRQKGIEPDLLLVRSENPISQKSFDKITLFSNLRKENTFNLFDVTNIYEIPLVLRDLGLTKALEKKLNIKIKPNLKELENYIKKINQPKQTIKIAICGKYTELKDSYASLIEAIKHAATNQLTKEEIELIDVDQYTNQELEQKLKTKQAIIVPIGFGPRGTENKIHSIKIARQNNIPFLGLCLGLQLSVIEFARNICGIQNAHTTEINPQTQNPIITILEKQKQITTKGETMRLGIQKTKLKQGTKTQQLYGQEHCYERHRHRYEVNPQYIQTLEEKGLIISGKNEQENVVEFIELPNHKFFIATQSHPEYNSTYKKPSPLFTGLIKAAKN